MMQPMKLLRQLKKLEQQVEEMTHLRARESRTLIRNVGLVSAGVTVVAVGLVVGRELRQRYKFSRRTPYDLYAHSGDSMQDVEFGVGI
jgi:hypothetical protein